MVQLKEQISASCLYWYPRILKVLPCLQNLGITEQTSSQMTTAMMAVFLQYRAGTPFSASALDDGTAGNLKQTTSEQNPILLDELAVEAGLV